MIEATGTNSQSGNWSARAALPIDSLEPRPLRTTMIAVAVVCAFSTCCPAQNETAGVNGSKLLALESVWNQAEEKGDIRALDLIFDESMVYIDEDGTMLTKSQFLIRAKKAGTQLQSLTTHSMTAHVYGNLAVVVGSYRANGTEHGKPYQRDGRFIDVWIFKRGAWVCVVAQATRIIR